MHTLNRHRSVFSQYLMIQILVCSSKATQLTNLGVPYTAIISTICWAGHTSLTPSEAEIFYHNISNGTLGGGFSTVVNKLCICWQQNSSNCTNLDGTIVYPGMTLHFPVAALDVFNQVTFAEISLKYGTPSGTVFYTLTKKWYLEPPTQIIAQNSCTLVNVTFLKHTSTTMMILCCFY